MKQTTQELVKRLLDERDYRPESDVPKKYDFNSDGSKCRLLTDFFISDDDTHELVSLEDKPEMSTCCGVLENPKDRRMTKFNTCFTRKASTWAHDFGGNNNLHIDTKGIWLQSDSDVWYKLGEPHVDYKDFYDRFFTRATLFITIYPYIDKNPKIHYHALVAKMENEGYCEEDILEHSDYILTELDGELKDREKGDGFFYHALKTKVEEMFNSDVESDEQMDEQDEPKESRDEEFVWYELDREVAKHKYRSSILKSQWVSKVIYYSSKYSTTGMGRGDWAAENLIGPFSVYPKYEDNPKAWAPLYENGGKEKLILGFKTPIVLSKIEIYETYNPGAVVNIATQHSKHNAENQWMDVYESEPQQPLIPQKSRIFSPEISFIDTPIDRVLILMNTKLSAEWSEIDAVCIHGYEYIKDLPTDPDVTCKVCNLIEDRSFKCCKNFEKCNNMYCEICLYKLEIDGVIDSWKKVFDDDDWMCPECTNK